MILIQQTREEKVKERLRTISEMESRYDGLQIEKRQLESSINKIPLHGRVDRNSRKQKVGFLTSWVDRLFLKRSIYTNHLCSPTLAPKSDAYLRSS